MDPITLTNLLWMVVGVVGGAIAKHVMSGKPPLVDPQNKRPLVDMIRDEIRNMIAGGTVPQPVPLPAPMPAPADHPLINELVKALLLFLQQTNQPPPPGPKLAA